MIPDRRSAPRPPMAVALDRVVQQSDELLLHLTQAVESLNVALRKESFPMSQPPIIVPENPVEAARVLAVAMAALTNEVQELRQTRRADRNWVRLAIGGLIFDIALSVALGVGFFRVQNVSDHANRASSSAVVNCVARNKSGLDNKALWQPLIDKSPPPSTPEQRQSTDEFQAKINALAVQQDCTALGR